MQQRQEFHFRVPAFAVFCTSRKESGGFTQGCRLLLADLFLFPVKDFLLHGCKVAGDRTEIGTYHLVGHFGVYLSGADMLVTEYL